MFRKRVALTGLVLCLSLLILGSTEALAVRGGGGGPSGGAADCTAVLWYASGAKMITLGTMSFHVYE